MGLLLKFLRKLDVKTGQHPCRPSSAQAVVKAGQVGKATAAAGLALPSEPEKVGKVETLKLAKFNQTYRERLWTFGLS